MSVIGTVILYPPADDGSGAARYAEPTIVGLRDLLFGRGASATEGNVDIEVPVLRRARRVPEPDARHRSRPNPFTRLVSSGCAACRTTSPRAARRLPADIGFVNNTTEPGLQDAVGCQRQSRIEHRRDADRDLGRDRARLRGDLPQPRHPQAMSALSQALKRTGVEQQYIDAIRENAQEAQRQLLAEKQAAYAKVRSVSR